METGLEGNIFSFRFRDFGHLATHSWIKILWEYLDYLDITLQLCLTTNIPPVREQDQSLIQLFSDKGWKRKRLEALNRVRKFKKVHRLSCITACDGRQIRPDILNRLPGDSTRKWSVECPTPADFRLWRTALQDISSPQFRLGSGLGALLATSHIPNLWSVNLEGDSLCRTIGDGSFALYEMVRPFRFTRSGPRFSFKAYTSTDPASPDAVKLHSSALIPRSLTPLSPRSVLEILHSWENQSLWEHLRVDGDGNWITSALVAGSLDIVHNGSYMKKVTPLVCSTALLMKCRITQAELVCTWAEMSTSADNYRGELLGALCCSLILKAAASVPATYPPTPVQRHCDNMGVIKHGNRMYSALKDGQAQADLIRLFHSLDSNLPFPFEPHG